MNDPQPANRVLCVPAAVVGRLQGFLSAGRASPLTDLTLPGVASYRPRAEAEDDTAYKQLIPYILLHRDGEFFGYTRAKGQGEARLLGRRSIGIGGHVEEYVDGEEGVDRTSPAVLRAAMRELDEEVGVDLVDVTLVLAGLVNDDSDPVGRVHLGVVFVADLPSSCGVIAKEASMDLVGFRAPETLRADRDLYESWSRICIDALDRILASARKVAP